MDLPEGRVDLGPGIPFSVYGCVYKCVRTYTCTYVYTGDVGDEERSVHRNW